MIERIIEPIPRLTRTVLAELVLARDNRDFHRWEVPAAACYICRDSAGPLFASRGKLLCILCYMRGR